jgi:tetratricopeptide (TPR) repeat protein
VLQLPSVTLVCADTANHALALRALAASQADVRYGRALFLTDAIPPGVAVPEGVEVVRIAPLDSRDAYSQLMLKSLLPHVDTPHALVIQWDGYVVNNEAWDPAFLDCDYIGAKWYWHADGMRVGNGGFSLRSRKLLAALQDPRIVLDEAEDATICRTFRPLLERDHAIRYADEALADRFSFEAAYPIGRPFGFHGLFNFCRTVPPAEIAALAPAFSGAIARSPQLMQLLRNCLAMGQWDAARAIAQRVLAEVPGNAEAKALFAQVDARAAAPMSAGRNDPCPCGSGRKFKQCHGALGTGASVGAPAAHDAGAIVRAAVAAHQRGDLDSAERGYREALTLHAAHPMAMHFLGVAHYQRGRIDDALPLLKAAVEAQPNEAEFHNNLGLALAAAGRNEEAIAAYKRALELTPAHAIAWSNLGLALQVENRLPEAIDAFRHALSIAPEFAQAHWNLSLALLANQEFAEGWREYEWRFRAPELAHRARVWPGRRWDGANPAGRTLLVTSEQGMGDTLHFVRVAQPLAARGARVVVSADAALVRLLATAPGVDAVIGPDDTPPPYDAHVPLMTLAGMLAVTPESTLASVPYLAADPARRAEVAPILAAHAGVRRIGVAWSGSRVNTQNRRRSIPLATLASLFTLPGIAWFSLQRSIDEEEIAGVPEAAALHRLPAREDFDGMAALVAELDLVISIDTSIAHLGGALARPTWLLLAAVTDWRWYTRDTDTPWYPTFRLFRQTRLGDWDAVVREVAAALAVLPAER